MSSKKLVQMEGMKETTLPWRNEQFQVKSNEDKLPWDDEDFVRSDKKEKIPWQQEKQYVRERKQRLPWQKQDLNLKGEWVKKQKQTVNSPNYRQLKQFIHMPYRKIDHLGIKSYYFPTYVYFKIKNITQFDFQSLSARINGVLTIKIRVNYQDKFSPDSDKSDQKIVRSALEQLFQFQFDNKNKKMGKEQQDQKLGKQQNAKETQKIPRYLYVQFNRDDPLRFPAKRVADGQIEKDIEGDDNQTIICWTVRKQFTVALAPGTLIQDLIAPFNLMNFKLSLSFQDVDIPLKPLENRQKGQQNNKDVKKDEEILKFKFNCMKRVGDDSPEQKTHIFQQLSFTDDGSLGQYDLAEQYLDVQCKKYLSQQHTADISTLYRSYKTITFTFPFYKYPIMDSLTIFIPLVLITILALFTFAQGPDLNDKIGNISTLMIVYVGLMPVISDSLPPTTNITLIDIVVYCQLAISVMCLVRGYIIKDYSPDQFNNYHIWSDPVFITSIVIAVITTGIMLFLLVLFCYKKKYSYNLQESDIDEHDRRLKHWVSPHMYGEARNIKTQVEKIRKEKQIQRSEHKQNKKR